MCRLILYLGPEVVIASVVTEPTHGLIQQSKQAKDPNSVAVNADGFGLLWYAHDISPIPACYKDVTPAWSSQNLKQIARVVKSTCIFAHVRAASAGTVVQTNCHPFCYRNMSFMHNGTVPYLSCIKMKILREISENGYDLIQGSTDSELLFAVFITFFERMSGIHEESEKFKDESYKRDENTRRNMADALKATINLVHKLVLEYEHNVGQSLNSPLASADGPMDMDELGKDGADQTPLPCTQAVGRLNLAVTDGHISIASRYVCAAPKHAHSLYYSRGYKVECKQHEVQVVNFGERCCKSNKQFPMLLVSSEPLGRAYECEMIPTNHMVVADRDGYFCIEPCN